MVGVEQFGDPKRIGLRIEWSTQDPTGDAEQRTLASAVLEVGSVPVWGTREAPFEWTWIELLEFLAEAWRFLVWEETYPEGLNPQRPALLEHEFERQRDEMSSRAAAALHEEVLSFYEHHDLSRALHGVSASPVLLVRMGELCVVSTQRKDMEVRFEVVIDLLGRIGDTIAKRLAGADDARSSGAVEAWSDRETASDEFVMAFGARLPPSHWAPLRNYLPDQRSAWPHNEFFVAARFAGSSLDSASFANLLNAIASIEKRPTPELDRLSEHAISCMTTDDRAFREGYQLARSMREILGGVSSAKPVDVVDVLTQLGVGIHDVNLETTELDAVAIFGPLHGPAILINKQGLHASARGGRRASLAHELCHLLVDRNDALPAAEVLLRGKGPRRPEQRANAFAAEFLVPSAEALDMTRSASPQTRADWITLVDKIAHSFGASQTVVVWQILNAHEAAGEAIALPAARWLKALVS